jgi:type IV pilus assembly protein PilX
MLNDQTQWAAVHCGTVRQPGKPLSRHRQRGISLMVALIVLVALTLAGLSLMRSMDTTNLIAGNLAFQQSATHSGDVGTETAILWLQANAGTTTTCPDSSTQPTLECDNPGVGFFATRANPGATQTWDNFWTTTLVPAGVVTLPTDAVTGNTVSYVIHRLCNAPGAPTNVPSPGCAFSMTQSASTGNSMSAGFVQPNISAQIYYRITTRIDGPRNTVSYVQTIVAQ